MWGLSRWRACRLSGLWRGDDENDRLVDWAQGMRSDGSCPCWARMSVRWCAMRTQGAASLAWAVRCNWAFSPPSCLCQSVEIAFC